MRDLFARSVSDASWDLGRATKHVTKVYLNLSGEQSFEEFETYVLEFKRVCHMDATAGR